MNQECFPGGSYPPDFDVRRALELAWLNDPNVQWQSKVVCPAPCGASVALRCRRPGSINGDFVIGLVGRSGKIEDLIDESEVPAGAIEAQCRRGHDVTFDPAGAQRTRRLVAERVART